LCREWTLQLLFEVGLEFGRIGVGAFVAAISGSDRKKTKSASSNKPTFDLRAFLDTAGLSRSIIKG